VKEREEKNTYLRKKEAIGANGSNSSLSKHLLISIKRFVIISNLKMNRSLFCMNGNNPNIVQKGISQWAKKLSVRVYF